MCRILYVVQSNHCYKSRKVECSYIPPLAGDVWSKSRKAFGTDNTSLPEAVFWMLGKNSFFAAPSIRASVSGGVYYRFSVCEAVVDSPATCTDTCTHTRRDWSEQSRKEVGRSRRVPWHVTHTLLERSAVVGPLFDVKSGWVRICLIKGLLVCTPSMKKSSSALSVLVTQLWKPPAPLLLVLTMSFAISGSHWKLGWHL